MTATTDMSAGRPLPSASPEAGQRRVGLILSAPAALLLLILLILPSSVVLVLSLTDYELGMPGLNFVGAANYLELIGDRSFLQSVGNTVSYLLMVAPVSIAAGLAVALLIHGRGIGGTIYRAIYFLPVTGTLVALATAWEVIFHPSLGIANLLLATLGMGKVRFLADPHTALLSLSVIGIWQIVGFNMVLFLAGLATIPKELYDAAEMDGADGGWRRFLLVTWPMLGPVTVFATTITLIRCWSVFETVALLTDGGPQGATSVILFSLFQNGFRYFRVGYASAIAVTFLFAVVLLTLVQHAVSDRRTHY
jgi:multiple sugar transport system permease protein